MLGCVCLSMTSAALSGAMLVSRSMKGVFSSCITRCRCWGGRQMLLSLRSWFLKAQQKDETNTHDGSVCWCLHIPAHLASTWHLLQRLSLSLAVSSHSESPSVWDVSQGNHSSCQNTVVTFIVTPVKLLYIGPSHFWHQKIL